MIPSIEITIPILNEESTLYKQICKISNFMEQNLYDFGPIRILLADNGSIDNTPEIARLLTQKFKNVSYLRLEQKGVGRALKASWCQSKAVFVGYMDLDLSTDLRHLRSALEKLCADQADIVTGTRLAAGSKVVGRSPLRNFTSRCFNRIVKMVFRTSFSDGMCGFKFLKRNCLDDLMSAGAQSDGWFFASELLITADYLGYRIYDLAVEWTDDPNSKVKIGKLSLEYLKAMRILRSRLLERKKGL